MERGPGGAAPRRPDCINHQDGLITISDSSDEEFPPLLDAGARQRQEEEDDDVVILQETPKQKLLRPNVIRPAALWQRAKKLGEGGPKLMRPIDLQEEVLSLPCQGAQHNRMTETGAGPSKDVNGNHSPQLPGPSELSWYPLKQEGDLEPGPSVFEAVKTSPRLRSKREIINLEEADFRPKQEESVETGAQKHADLGTELLQNLRGAAVAAATAATNGQSNQGSTRLDPSRCKAADRGSHPVVNCCAPQLGQAEAELGSLPVAYREETPGPAFPRPEPQQDGIPGPASPQPAHPPEETKGHPAAIDNEQPGPAFPAQGSHELGSGNVPEQGAAGQDKELTALLIRETEARFPDAKREYIEELILIKNCCDLNVLCNFLLENPDYPKKEGRVVLNPNSSLLASQDETKVPKVDYFDFSKLAPLDQRCFIQAADLLMADFKMLSSQDIKWALHELKGHYAITRKVLQLASVSLRAAFP